MGLSFNYVEIRIRYVNICKYVDMLIAMDI